MRRTPLMALSGHGLLQAESTQANAQALFVVDDPIFFAHRAILLGLASVARLQT
jgi:hypothetical protein